jgi:hypothetical protein
MLLSICVVVFIVVYYFSCCRRDYTSPHTLRVEFGIAQEMDQYDRNFKVRQLMGQL